MRNLPDFSYEQKLWQKGIRIVAGLDEVGRGSLAGPVVTACVIFSCHFDQRGEIPCTINDSKQLSSAQRELANVWIKENATSYGIGQASVAEINKYGIVGATNKAFRRALNIVVSKYHNIDFILVDAFYIPYTKDLPKTKQSPIVKGDTKSISIAAASIIAKVHRDNLMEKLSKNIKYRKYNWAKNKGYGTLDHRVAIKKHGITNYHRKLFVRKLITS